MNFGSTKQNGQFEIVDLKSSKVQLLHKEINNTIIKLADSNMREVRSNFAGKLKDGINIEFSGDGFYGSFNL